GGHDTIGISRICPDTKGDIGPIGLGCIRQVFDRPRCKSNRNGQDADCGRIQRPGVTDASLPQDPADLADNIMTRPACWFIDHQVSVIETTCLSLCHIAYTRDITPYRVPERE